MTDFTHLDAINMRIARETGWHLPPPSRPWRRGMGERDDNGRVACIHADLSDLPSIPGDLSVELLGTVMRLKSVAAEMDVLGIDMTIEPYDGAWMFIFRKRKRAVDGVSLRVRP